MPSFLHVMLMSKVTPGVINQMRWESQAARDSGLNWDVKIFCPESDQFTDDFLFVKSKLARSSLLKMPLGRLIFWGLLRLDYYWWLLRSTKNYDYFLIRYNVADPFLLLFSLVFRGRHLLVHHTLELPELRHYKGFVPFAMYCYERVFGQVNLSLAYGLIGVTKEIVEHELARMCCNRNKLTYVYPNGILYSPDMMLLDLRGTDGSCPEIIFVASEFYEWHGLDLLLSNLKDNVDSFVLHLVGSLNESDLLVAQNDSRVILHGTLNSRQLFNLYAKCTVGLSSFGLSRKGMNMACTLKVREYLSAGLPVYSGHLDVFPNDFQFYRNGPARIGDILNYCARVRIYKKETVSGAAMEYISKASLMGRLYDSIVAEGR